MVLMAGLLALKTDELEKVQQFEHWGEPDFLFSFFLASAMGSILNYSIFLCTLYNSALTTTVVGCLKNVLTTYIGVSIDRAVE
jgi:solute carrier family 35